MHENYPFNLPLRLRHNSPVFWALLESVHSLTEEEELEIIEGLMSLPFIPERMKIEVEGAIENYKKNLANKAARSSE